MKDILVYAKAIAALLGAIVTAVLGVIPESPQWLVIVGVVFTVVATWAVPNRVPEVAQD